MAEEGGEATFQCVVSPGDSAVMWFREGALLQPSQKFLISQSGSSHSLTISGLTVEDAGQITAEAEGVQSSAALRVRGEWMGLQGGPLHGLVPLQPSAASLGPAGLGDLDTSQREEGGWAAPRGRVPTQKGTR